MQASLDVPQVGTILTNMAGLQESNVCPIFYNSGSTRPILQVCFHIFNWRRKCLVVKSSQDLLESSELCLIQVLIAKEHMLNCERHTEAC